MTEKKKKSTPQMKQNKKILYGDERKEGEDLKLNEQKPLKPKENCQQLFLTDCFFNYVCKKEQVVIICLYPHMLTS